jgi:tetratricopeptide (TPR) repeat protein
MRRQYPLPYIAAFFVACVLCLTLSAQDVKSDATPETKSKVSQLFALANSYLAEKKHDQAIDTYRELLKLEPMHPSAQYNLGVALANTRRYPEALEAFQIAVKLAPSQPAFHASLGGVYMSLRRWDESLAALNEAIRLDPNRGETYNVLGFLYDNTRRFEEALAANKKACELAPANPANFHNLGLTYMKLGRPAEAVAPLETALKMAPTYRSARFHLSNAFSRLKRYKEAVDSFTKLLELEPDDDEVLTLRAWNYMYLGGLGLEAATDAERYLKLYGWRTESAPYQVLIAIVGFRSAGMDERATAVIAQSLKKADTTGWPYKIILMFDGQMTSDDLLAAAANTDQRTEARTFIGMDLLLKKKTAEARSHFEWVKQYGNPTFSEYPLALAELDRMR